MHNLPCVTIDAGVLAVPCVDCTQNDVFQYVDTLLDWSKLLDEPWVSICMSERATETLLDENLYPQRSYLCKIFNKYDIVEYSVNDIMKVTQKLLSLTPSFETCYRVKDVLLDNLETDPDVIRLTTHNGHQPDLARCITLIAVLRKYCSQPLGGHSLVLREAPKQIIQIKAQIFEIEHDRDDLPALPCPPKFFEGDVLVCNNFHGLIECFDESAILVGASDNFGIEIAVRIAIFKNAISQDEAPDWANVIGAKIGANFRSSCQQVCADQGDAIPPKILRAVVETVNGKNLSAVHALRKGSGGNDPQRMRGSDKAQRRDIDREFHLHYWACADGTAELASVVYHNDFTIPE